MKTNRIRAVARVLPFLLLAGTAYAQSAPPAPPVAAVAAPGAMTAPAVPVAKERLDQMLAPIALYPDELVTNILMASTYPSEVVEATNWLKQPNNAALKGDALADALRPQTWDPSVKFLMPFPQVIQQLNDRADWMQELGNAFTVQQADVMNEVQHLRQLAFSCGKLQTTPQQVVTRHHSVIAIAPADPRVVYVPVYNPVVVYGAWPYAAYPPRYFGWPSGFVLGGVGFGLDVGIGYSVGFGAVGPYWGWSRPDWRRGMVNVDFGRVGRFGNYDRAVMNRRFAGGRWRAGATQIGRGQSAETLAASSRRHGLGHGSQGRHANAENGRGEYHSGGGKHNQGHRDNGWHGKHNGGGQRGEEHAGGGKHNEGHRDNGWHGKHDTGAQNGGGGRGNSGEHGNHGNGDKHGGGGHDEGGGHGKSH